MIINFGRPNILTLWPRQLTFIMLLRLIHISCIFTARVRSTREGTVFTGVCLLTFQGGYPVPGLGGTPARSGWWGEGYPISGLGWGGTPARSWLWGGGTRGTWGTPTIKTWLVYPPPTIKTWPGYPPDLGWGTSHHQDLAGVPPTLGWGTPLDLGWCTPYHQELAGVPPLILGWDTPQTWDGVPPQPGMGYPHEGLAGVLPHPGMGYSPRPGMGSPPPPTRQSSIASTCYTAGGMPLAFMQEDFLV